MVVLQSSQWLPVSTVPGTMVAPVELTYPYPVHCARAAVDPAARARAGTIARARPAARHHDIFISCDSMPVESGTPLAGWTRPPQREVRPLAEAHRAFPPKDARESPV